MEITTTKMKRLYFKKSKNKQNEECFIAKIKEFTQEVGGKKEFKGDAIVIANPDKCKIHKSGRWDVEVREMFGAKGFLVLSAEWTIDTLDFSIDWDSFCVSILVNGEETKLKRTDKDSGKSKFLPLSFTSENYYPINKIVDSIKEKCIYLQLEPSFHVDYFLAEFTRACEAVYKEYKNNKSQYSVPNTPMAEALKNLK